MAYIFLKSADRHEHRQDPRWWVISEDRIETLNVSDTYDQYGQSISNSDAGDYLEILTETAAQVANEAWNETDAEETDFVKRFSIGDNVTAYDYRIEFEEIITQCKEGVDYILYNTECSGFNYWDGRKWRTIIINSVDDNNTHEIEDDDEIITRLNEALENEEFIKEGFGRKTYRYKDAKITYSQFASSWEYAEITLDNEFESEEQ